MSLQTFKKKGVITAGSRGQLCQFSPKRSGYHMHGTDGTAYWISVSSPALSAAATAPAANSSNSGFSINGGSRSQGYIGQSMAMSRRGTPYHGVYARGCGGAQSKYTTAEPLLNQTPAKSAVRGEQQQFVKPSVVSTYGMLQHRLPHVFYGQYPCYWVQPVYPTGAQSDNAGQSSYVTTKRRQSAGVQYDINEEARYLDHFVCDCYVPWHTGNFHANFPHGGYTKTVKRSLDSSEQLDRVMRKCAQPLGPQKPFPFATPPSTATKVPYVGSAAVAPLVQSVSYLQPPAWYTRIPAACAEKLTAAEETRLASLIA